MAGPDQVALTARRADASRGRGVDGVTLPSGTPSSRPRGRRHRSSTGSNAALNDVLAEPDSIRLIADHGVAVSGGGVGRLAELVSSELARWTGVVEVAGLTPVR